MAFTYDLSTDIGKVRFEIQDTDSGNVLLQDAEITYALSQEVAVLGSSARCCEALARRFAAKADTTIGSLKFTWSTMAENYAARAKELRIRAGTGAPWAGGISQADKDARAANTDRVQPRAARGQFDNPDAGPALPPRPGF